jgi:multidrug efflux system outer membrane protein
MKLHPASLAALLVLLVACQLEPASRNVAPALPEKFSSDGIWREAKPESSTGQGDDWWKWFNDAALDGLMRKLRSQNLDLMQAASRVETATQTARAAASGLWPSASLRQSVQRDRSTGELQFQFAGGRSRNQIFNVLELQYEVDFWGRIRSGRNAAGARAEAARADWHTALVLLQSELAMRYFELRAQDAQIELLKRTVAVRQHAVELAQLRQRRGDIADMDVAQARTDLSETQAEAIGLERRRLQLEQAIALLLAETPGRFKIAAQPWKQRSLGPPRSVPSELLLRRADVVSALWQVKALNAEIGVARAGYFPSLSLSLRAGTQTSFWQSIGDQNASVWGLGPLALDWPLLRGGRLRAAHRISKARYEEGVAAYRQAVLRAMGEVEDALGSWDILQRQRAMQEQTQQQATRALEMAQKRYDSGLVAYYEVLDAQRTLLRSQRELTRLQGEVQLLGVLLVKALGGGWKWTPPPSGQRAKAGSQAQDLTGSSVR